MKICNKYIMLLLTYEVLVFNKSKKLDFDMVETINSKK